MAYQLTLEDLQPSKQPYKLTLEDIRGSAQAQQPEGLLQRAAAYPGMLAEEVGGAPLSQTIPTAIGGVQRGLQHMVSGLAPFQLGQLESPVSGMPSPFQQPELAQIPGEAPEELPYLAGAAEAAPDVAMYASMAPGLARLGAAGIRGAIGAVERAPEAAMKIAERIPGIRTLAGANITKATREGEAAISEAKNALRKSADKVYADYYDTPNYQKLVGQENRLVGEGNLKNYRSQKKTGVEKYNDVSNAVGGKRVNIDKPLDSFISNERYGGIVKKDSALDKQIKLYQDKKTFDSAHKLQSQLGKRKANEVGKREPDWDIVDYLDKAQKSIVKEITPTGGKKYEEATRHWRQNVVPYEDVPAFNRLVKKGDVRSNFSNALTKAEIDTGAKNQLKSIDRIVSHMSPEQKEKVLLSHIVGTPGSPAINALGEINPSVTLKTMQGLQMKGMSPFMTKDTKGYIKNLDRLTKEIGKRENALAKEIERQQSIAKYARYGAGGILGLEAIRRAK